MNSIWRAPSSTTTLVRLLPQVSLNPHVLRPEVGPAMGGAWHDGPPGWRGEDMDSRTQDVSDLLHEAAETHHQVYRIVDGDDPDWASWYADWLINLSELPQILKVAPVRSELVFHLVRLDKEFVGGNVEGKWEDFYAQQLIQELGAD